MLPWPWSTAHLGLFRQLDGVVVLLQPGVQLGLALPVVVDHFGLVVLQRRVEKVSMAFGVNHTNEACS